MTRAEAAGGEAAEGAPPGEAAPADGRPELAHDAASSDGSWVLYVLRCGDGSLYTGITTDLDRRLAEHQAGKGARYTRGRLPVECAVSWPYPDRSSASRAEHAFKQLRRAEKLRFLAAPADWPAEGPSPDHRG